ncbi:hypothetical protein [Emcibacter sp. SYSU 3D8]|uniref:hypothetical protein n=1 Tax=Emcibacter sp. SYSU 3D8 TaxID=3133969 RepID=UPI0031FF098C
MAAGKGDAAQAGAAKGGIAALWGDARAVGGIVVCALGFGAGYAIRYRFVEPEAMGAACERGDPWWCPLRTGFIMFTQGNGFGWLSLLLAVVAIAVLAKGGARAARWLAIAGLAAAGLGMILYNNTMSVPAAILALICLIRAR